MVLAYDCKIPTRPSNRPLTLTTDETGYIYFIMTFCFLLWPIYGFDSRGLSHIPGPFLASLSKLVMVYHLLRGRLSTWYAEVSDSYSSPLASESVDRLRSM